MAHLDGVVKPKTKRSKRFLDHRAPKLLENSKNAMIMKGGNTSETVTQALKDIYSLKKPNVVLYKKKNIMRPFEDSTSLEFFSKKTDCSLFLFGSHNKKRPNNLVFASSIFSVLVPLVLNQQKVFNSAKDPHLSKAINKQCFTSDTLLVQHPYLTVFFLLVDFFRGPVVPAVRLAGLEHILHFTAADGKIFMRSYRVLLKKSGCRTPRIELEEIGPSFDFVLRRTHLASDDLYKTAHKQPKGLKPKKKKNISHDTFGTKFGRLHMQKQNLDKLQTRKMKGLRKRRGAVVVENGETTSPKKIKTQE
uniref:Ribosome production factor 2 homolog n=1 Tax=Astyanax mexicanus TaxID=7994 RepID=A0A8B9KMX1_ASTMX